MASGAMSSECRSRCIPGSPRSSLRERMAAMIVEHATHPQFLSNTSLLADGEGGPAFFIDAGGPVQPLIEAAGRLGLEPTHLLLTHHHYDHVCDVAELRARWPDLEVLISSREKDLLVAAAEAGGDEKLRSMVAGMGVIEAGQRLW